MPSDRLQALRRVWPSAAVPADTAIAANMAFLMAHALALQRGPVTFEQFHDLGLERKSGLIHAGDKVQRLASTQHDSLACLADDREKEQEKGTALPGRTAPCHPSHPIPNPQARTS